MRPAQLHPFHRSEERPRVREGLRYAWGITEIRPTIAIVAVVGTLVYNFPTFLTLMAEETFHGDAGLAGLLMAVLGVGTVIGALAAAHRAHQTGRTVVLSGAALGGAMIGTAVLPTEFAVAVALVPVGALAVFFGSTANAHMQLWSAPQFRGRVMAIYTLLTFGTTVIGGPLAGWICQRWSARAGIGVAGAATLLMAIALSPRMRKERNDRALEDIELVEEPVDLA
jgi:MFS family permease